MARSQDCPHCERTLPSSRALEDHVQRAHPEAGDRRDWTPILVSVLAVLAVGAVAAVLITGGGEPVANPYHIEESPRTGDEGAPVKLIAFESPACTSCRLFHIPRGGEASTYARVLETYADTGQIQYVEKFARAGYGWDRVGGNAQKCAWHLGGWPAFHDLTQGYYENRPNIDGSNAASFAMQWASGSDTVDTDAFSTCFEENRHDGDITRDLADGERAGVRGTPTFVIVSPDGDERQIVGPQPYETFANAIEGALADTPDDGGDDANTTTDGSSGNATQARRSQRG